MNFKLLPIEGFNGYYAGENGGIYSYWTRGVGSRIDLDKVPTKLSPCLDGKGRYLHVCIKNKDGEFETRNIAPIICRSFNGLPNEGEEVSHLDGNKLNNNPNNLLWEGRSKNHQRKKIHGTDDRGYKNSRSLVTKEQLIEIRSLLNKGEKTHKEIGELFVVSRGCITKINTGYRYKNQEND